MGEETLICKAKFLITKKSRFVFMEYIASQYL